MYCKSSDKNTNIPYIIIYIIIICCSVCISLAMELGVPMNILLCDNPDCQSLFEGKSGLLGDIYIYPDQVSPETFGTGNSRIISINMRTRAQNL